jgi:hypothetical protein
MPNPYANPFNDDDDDDDDDEGDYRPPSKGHDSMKRMDDLEKMFQSDVNSLKQELSGMSSKTQSSTSNSALSQEEEDSIFWANEDATLHNLSDSYTLPDEDPLMLFSDYYSPTANAPSNRQNQKVVMIPAPLIDGLDMSDSSNSLKDTPLMGTGNFIKNPSLALNNNCKTKPQNNKKDEDAFDWEDEVSNDSITSDRAGDDALPEWKQESAKVLPEWQDEDHQHQTESTTDEHSPKSLRDSLEEPLCNPLLMVDKTPEQVSDRDLSSTDFYVSPTKGEGAEREPFQRQGSTRDRPNRSQKKDWRAWGVGIAAIVLCCGIIACAILLPLHFLVWSKNNDDATSSSTPAPTAALLPALPSFTLEAMAKSSLSPQARAYKWLHDDPMAQSYTEARLLQRFAMATLFYALRGENWTTTTANEKLSSRWLSYEHSECEWGVIGESGFTLSGDASNYCAFKDNHSNGTTSNDNNNIATSSGNPTEAVVAQSAPDKSNIFNHDSAPSGSGSQQRRYLRRGSNHNDKRQSSSRALQGSSDGDDPGNAIQQLYLPRMNLVGSLPPELSLLTNLKLLNLDTNSIFGTLPTEMVGLRELRTLRLAQNVLTGPIPADQAGAWMMSLWELDLSRNQFSKTLPEILGSLSNLQALHVHENMLEGKLVNGFGAWGASLTSLQLHNNLFTGSLPSEIGLLSNVQIFSVDHNSLTGVVPTQLGAMIKLEDLQLYSNNFQGEIPSQIGRLNDLKMLAVAENKFHGALPSELGMLTKLEQLWLYDNDFSDALPEAIGNLGLALLKHAIIYNNSFTGTIPEDLCGIEEFQFDCGPEYLCGCECNWCGTNGTTVTPSTTETPINATAEDATGGASTSPPQGDGGQGGNTTDSQSNQTQAPNGTTTHTNSTVEEDGDDDVDLEPTDGNTTDNTTDSQSNQTQAPNETATDLANNEDANTDTNSTVDEGGDDDVDLEPTDGNTTDVADSNNSSTTVNNEDTNSSGASDAANANFSIASAQGTTIDQVEGIDCRGC